MKSEIYISVGSVFGSALLWLLSFKLVACWFGPEGVGLFSQLRQITQAATIAITYGGTNAIVQSLAERRNNLQACFQLRGTASRLVIITAGLIIALALLFATPATHTFLSSDSDELIRTLRLICFAILLNVGSTYTIAVLNGYCSYKLLALAQLAGPLALVIALSFLYFMKFPFHAEILGYLLIVCFLFAYLAGSYGVLRLPKPALSALKANYLSKTDTAVFIKFAAATLIAAISSTVSLLFIRAWIIESHGLAFAGLFDAAWTLTFNYITLLLTACSTLYLPLLASSMGDKEQKTYLLKTAYLILVSCTLICFFIVVFQKELISILYTPEFAESGQLIVILTVAVIFRSISWVYGMLIVAKKNTRMLILSDLTFNLLLLISAQYVMQNYSSMDSIGWIFVLPHFFYLTFVLEYACYNNKLLTRRQIWPLIILAVLPLLLIVLCNDNMPILSKQTNFIFMATGLAVSGLSWCNYKKIAL
ncbi:hypothetical protein [Methylomonas sp. AM2-LC]|uniref:hypothetical protein n=1 Tax=Methylomonas sp. AM2-LC TaxID=3153301 RepID=UPI003264A070